MTGPDRTPCAPRGGGPLLLALVTALAVGPALILGCGGGRSPHGGSPATLGHPPQRPEPPGAFDPTLTSPDVLRARITTLDGEIEARAATLGLEPWDPGAGAEPMADPGGALATCQRSPRPVCQDVCSLADAICDAADQICELADALEGDLWAAGRCTAGQVSCVGARQRCCAC